MARELMLQKDKKILWNSIRINPYKMYESKKGRNDQLVTAYGSPLSPRQHFSPDPLFLLLAPHIRDTLPKVFQIERPRDIPGHDTMDDCRGQHPKTHGLGYGSFILTDGLGKLADVSELALVDVLLPAERPRQAERERFRAIGDGAGNNDFLSGRDRAELERDGDLQATVFKNLAEHCMPPVRI